MGRGGGFCRELVVIEDLPLVLLRTSRMFVQTAKHCEPSLEKWLSLPLQVLPSWPVTLSIFLPTKMLNIWDLPWRRYLFPLQTLWWGETKLVCISELENIFVALIAGSWPKEPTVASCWVFAVSDRTLESVVPRYRFPFPCNGILHRSLQIGVLRNSGLLPLRDVLPRVFDAFFYSLRRTDLSNQKLLATSCTYFSWRYAIFVRTPCALSVLHWCSISRYAVLFPCKSEVRALIGCPKFSIQSHPFFTILIKFSAMLLT